MLARYFTRSESSHPIKVPFNHDSRANTPPIATRQGKAIKDAARYRVTGWRLFARLARVPIAKWGELRRTPVAGRRAMGTNMLAYSVGCGAGEFHPPRERGTQARDAGNPASALSFFLRAGEVFFLRPRTGKVAMGMIILGLRGPAGRTSPRGWLPGGVCEPRRRHSPLAGGVKKAEKFEV